jgi:hypothetical protein
VAYGKNRLVWTNYWVDDTSVTTDGHSSPCFPFDDDRLFQNKRPNQHFHFQNFTYYQVRTVVVRFEPRTLLEDGLQLQVGPIWCNRKPEDPHDKKKMEFECHPFRERIESLLEQENFMEFHLFNSSGIIVCEVEIYTNSGLI